eukprot:1452076-Amphidinium_carterae.1
MSQQTTPPNEWRVGSARDTSWQHAKQQVSRTTLRKLYTTTTSKGLPMKRPDAGQLSTISLYLL